MHVGTRLQQLGRRQSVAGASLRNRRSGYLVRLDGAVERSPGSGSAQLSLAACRVGTDWGTVQWPAAGVAVAGESAVAVVAAVECVAFEVVA